MNKTTARRKNLESANQMRSKNRSQRIQKDYIRLIHKYPNDQLFKFVTKEGMTPEDKSPTKKSRYGQYIQDNLGTSSFTNFFSTWINPNTGTFETSLSSCAFSF